ncbi:MAG: hypothetical protein HOC05_08570 [Gemmatimonadetes bacterium]|nr:hypothetical protein [Gemmatimonadota bacterium]MBT5143755.1 hypothetical protein [Gemmatimonadota bacterium]MBT5590522.1 hypothetical protein [Gemmatimonadota bacterium]MBT5965607.1 hypothetical protein [Gemmatimonadota bacterium]MBT6627102.1 hypothetical protein [Gemmatimonadota bacterium]
MPRLVAALALGISLSLGATAVDAQSVAIEPPELARVPRGDAGDQLYWQQLQITLAHPDEASSEAIRIGLPPLLVLHDADGDGALFDEVRVVYRAVSNELPRFEASTTTTEESIVLSSQGVAAAGGQVYVQFPCRATSNSPSATAVSYGAIEFADPAEVDVTQQSPEISFIASNDLAAMGSMGIVDLAAPLSGAADTLTSARGTVYPASATVLVLDLPDLVFDGGEAHPNRRAGLGDGNDANDTPYLFYFATEPNLTQIGPDVATPAVVVADESIYQENEGTGASVHLLTRDLPSNTYWLYVVSEVTGRVPLGRSRALVVRHEPVIEQLGVRDNDLLAADAMVFDSGGLLDEQGQVNGEGPRRLVIQLQVVDHDDSARIHLFYSADPNLGPSDITRDGTLATLAGATAITGTDGVAEHTRRIDWRTVSPLVEIGDYYVYAVAVGGSQATVDRTTHQILVRHSPFLRLDDLDAAMDGASIITGGLRPQRFLTLGWGQSGVDGDVDADDEALISLYLSPTPDISIPDGVAQIEQEEAAHLIVAGLNEEDDDRLSNQFVWDLWSLADGDFVPTAMQDYYLYGVIDDGSLSRLTRMGGSTPTPLQFEHPPALLPLQPATPITVGAGESARISWQDMDLDDDARLRILLSPEDHGDSTDYSSVVSGQTYVVNSADGFAPSDVDLEMDLSEDDAADAFDLTTGHLQRGPNTSGAPQAGTYHVYLAITDDGTFGSDTRAWRTPGTLTLGGPAAIPARRVFNLLPENFTIGVNADRQQIDVVVDALEQSVDLVLITLRLDSAIFDVIDQDPGREGIQPFFVRDGFQGSKLVSNEATVEEGSLLLTCEYFDPAPDGIPALVGDRALVAMEIVAIAGDGISDIQLLTDADNGQPSQLERDGEIIVPATAEPLATARLIPGRGTVNGTVSLEGRTDHSASIDVGWRHWGAFLDIEDSLFAVSNDIDSDRAGVQVSLQPDGSFQLSQTPTGRLDLHVRIDGYLEGRIAGLELHPGSTLDNVRPATVTGDTLLLGGDVAGYLNADGISLPDNEVTLADWDFVASLFARNLAADADSARADITGDGQVTIRDLTLVSANYLGRGPTPVYRPVASDLTLDVDLAFAQISYDLGDTLKATLESTSWAGIRAVELALDFDADAWELVSATSTQKTLSVSRMDAAGGRWGVSRIGHGDIGGQPLSWQFVARARADAPRIRDVLLIDSRYRAVEVDATVPTSVEVAVAAPTAFSLQPNYPNPFNPTTTIQFDVASAAGDAVGVELDVYDAVGQRLVRLVGETMAVGRHMIVWNGRDRHGNRVSSGVYYARLRVGRQTQTRSMLLLK